MNDSRGRGIVHFMWKWQVLFRHSVDYSAKEALRAIGVGVDPTAVIVGFRANEEADFDYCIEPETEPIGGTNLAGVFERAEELYAAHEDANVRHSDTDLNDARHRALRDEARGRALCEALGAAADFGVDRRYFASASGRIENYDVYAVIGVIASRWAPLPTLTTRRRDRMTIVPSLPEAVVEEVLRRASTAMALREPPQGLDEGRSAAVGDVIGAAAERFVFSAALATGQWFGSQLFEHLDALAAQPYEGRTGVGTIILAANNDPGGLLDVEVTFRHPVRVANTRAFRKVLEMSGERLHILCDGDVVYGLGRVRADYDPASERAFRITVVGRGSWELTHHETPLLRVDNTRPRLPRARLSERQFLDTVERLFPEATKDDAAELWNLATTAAEQEHGTMVVVHRAAAAEAERLLPQAQAIDPVRLKVNSLRAITNIDGAVLVSPDALCHAVGVILDGQATGDGDAARGARYNSAVRYRHAAGNDCLVIIVSEDGMIDLLPDLNPRVDADRVERAVQTLETRAEGDVDFERFARARDHVDTVAFYLTADQCERANAATTKAEAHRWEVNQIQVHHGAYEPHPDMDDSYYLTCPGLTRRRPCRPAGSARPSV